MKRWYCEALTGLFLCVAVSIGAQPALAEPSAPTPAAAAPTTVTTGAQAVAATQPALAANDAALDSDLPVTSATTSTSAPAPATATTNAAVSPPPAPIVPTLTVAIDLHTQTMTITEDGSPMYSWPISSGTSEFPTPRGTFRPQWTAKMWYSRKYDNAPMPHAVFIHGGVAIHATYHTGALGRPASHGCIRLSPGNAKTFYNLVQRHGMKHTRVAVYGTPKWRSQNVASRKANKPIAMASAKTTSFWGWETSAYDTPPSYYRPRDMKRKRAAQKYRQAPTYPQANAYFSQQPPKYIYRNGQRYVYVQRRSNAYYNGY